MKISRNLWLYLVDAIWDCLKLLGLTVTVIVLTALFALWLMTKIHWTS
ncbi:hypothetical protein QM806_04605 [Rhodococcus sp. IEGM 1351]|nr:hypothetical protein [Rhodococcus sp. IEGM 1351]MDI9934736.1 hypothetical protein [Rhodococcus sp. IEGM 1351]